MNRVLQGDVFSVLPTIEAGSVDCCVTSPPYWMLRNYLPKDHPLKARELGSEKTPGEFIANMVRVFELVKVALADHGTCWVNIGETYSASGAGAAGKELLWQGDSIADRKAKRVDGIPAGNLCLIPQRLTIALQDNGWIVRSVIIWHKPAPMPASLSGWQWRRCRVKLGNGNQRGSGKQAENRLSAGLNERTKNSAVNGHFGPPQTGMVGHSGNTRGPAAAQWSDCPGCKKCSPNGGYVLRRGSWRPTSSYEPVIMLAKTGKYFADGEPVKTPPAAATVSRDQYTRIIDDPDEQYAVAHDHETLCDGANLRDVWRIAAEPLKEKHYAAYPTALVEKCLRAGCSAKGYCPECGAPWVRIVESIDTGKTQKMADGWDTGEGAHGSIHRNGREAGETGKPVLAGKTIGWRASCPHHDLPPRPGLVLDPFGGSGRTAITAQQLGLDSVSIELNPDYCAMARRLIRDDMPLMNLFPETSAS